MSNDIRDIVERLAMLEGRITPTTVKHGLNPQQKSVKQLPALFKPKHISVLTAKTDPEHPMHDYMVGDSIERDEESNAGYQRSYSVCDIRELGAARRAPTCPHVDPYRLPGVGRKPDARAVQTRHREIGGR